MRFTWVLGKSSKNSAIRPSYSKATKLWQRRESVFNQVDQGSTSVNTAERGTTFPDRIERHK
jgi:hypothetical protein